MKEKDINASDCKYSIIISFFNNEPSIEELHERLTAVMKKLGGTFEYCYVDDGSTDGTIEKLLELHRKDPCVNVIKLSRNFGHHRALWAGMSAAKGEVCILMDGDLQDRPEDIPGLVEKINDGYDVVYAIRIVRTESARRQFMSYLFWRMINMVSPYRCPPNQAVLRAFSRKVCDELVSLNEVHIFLAGLFSWVGFKHTSIEVKQDARKHGKSSYSLHKVFSQVLDAILPFSAKPLRLITFSGLFFSLLSFTLGFYFIMQHLVYGIGIQGWTSVIVSIFFSTGLILLSLGMIAEYLGRLYQQSLNRPSFIVETLFAKKGSKNE